MKSPKVLLVVTVVNVALIVGAWLVVAGASPGTAAQTDPAVVRASGFDLVNADGDVVAQLYLGTDGSGQLRLRDGSGEVRVKLGAADDGSGLVLMDDEPAPAVTASTDADGTRIVLTDGTDERTIKP